MCTLFPLHIISHVRLGYISWKGRMKYLISSRNTKSCSRTTLKGRSSLYGQIMAESSPQKSLGLRGSLALHTILNRMGLQNERTEPSWKQQNQCYMTRIFLWTFGRKQQGHLCMYKIVLLIEYMTTRIWKNISQERNQKSTILEYVAARCTYISQRRIGPSSILLGGRVYS